MYGDLRFGNNHDEDSDEEEQPKQEKKIQPFEAEELKTALGFIVGQDKFSDVTFLVGKDKQAKRIPAHRFILASQSPIFEAMLYNPFPEEKDSKSDLAPLEVKIDCDPENFKLFLSLLYTNKAKLDVNRVNDVLGLARKYRVDSVKALCLEYMEKGLHVDTACQMFENAPRTLGDEKFGLEFIEKHTDEVINTPGFLRLSPSRVLVIVKSNKLDVAEDALFTAIHNWGKAECKRNGVSANSDNVKRVVSELIPHIRFPLMKMPTLSDVAGTNLLSPDQMLSLYTWVNSADSDRDPTKMPFNCNPRNPDLPRFKYTDLRAHDGIIHWIGTAHGKEEWKNPHQSGAVVVSASSWSTSLNPGNQLFHVVERDPSVAYGTDNQADSWIQIDLQEYQVMPDYYRIANTRISNCMPRTWRIQGSNDAYDWTTLQEENNNDWNNGGVTTAAFPIENCRTAYRYFRIFQPGSSSAGGFGHLSIAGFELWGRVRRKGK